MNNFVTPESYCVPVAKLNGPAADYYLFTRMNITIDYNRQQLRLYLIKESDNKLITEEILKLYDPLTNDLKVLWKVGEFTKNLLVRIQFDV